MRAMVGPGQRPYLMKLYAPAGGEDGYGQPSPTYAYQEDVWADIRPVTRMEYTASRQAEAAVDVTIILAHRVNPIAATWVIMDPTGQAIYDIQSQAVLGYNEGLRLLCRLRQP